MRSLLTRTVERLGAPPRELDGAPLPMLGDALKSDESLVVWAQERDRVWREGVIRWGCAVAPSKDLSNRGPGDHALLIVAADDEGASPDLLHVVALRLADLMRQGATDPRLEPFEQQLRIGAQGLQVPSELGGTLPCRVYTVVAHRSQLPSGRLVHHLMPVLITSEGVRSAMLIPARYWDPRWSEAWIRGFTVGASGPMVRPRRLAWASRLAERSSLLHRVLVQGLASVPSLLQLGPLTLGLGLTVIGGLLLGMQPHVGWLLLASLGCMLIMVGAIAWTLMARNAPDPTDVGVGGELLDPDEASGLWSLIRDLESALDVMPIDHIVVDRSFDVRVIDRTPGTPMARPRSTLLIGLPLMTTMSPTHFRALLIHAMADGTSDWSGVGRTRSRIDGWVQGWRRSSRPGGPPQGDGLRRTLSRHVAAYSSLFHDLSNPLVSRATLEADRVAASHVGAQTFADALVRVDVLSGWWTTRWDGTTFHGAEGGPVPRPVARWRARGPELNATMARLALTASLRRGAGDSGLPSNGERLRELGVRGRLVGDPPTVASTLLGSSLLPLIDHVDDLFAVHFGEVWRTSRHASLRAHRRRDALAMLPPAQRTLAQCLELVRLCQEFDEPFLAAQHSLEAISRFPDQPEARLTGGLALLDIGDEQGLTQLREAMELDPGVAPEACAAAMGFLKERQMSAEMEAWGELWNRARGVLSQERVQRTPAIVVQGLAASSSGG